MRIMRIINTRLAEENDKINQDAPFLKLPPELLLRILEPCMITSTDGIPACAVISVATVHVAAIENKTPSPLAIYGSICRKLRPVAITAYYEQNIIHLEVLQEASQRVMPKPKPVNLVRFGKIWLERGGHKRSETCSLRHVGWKGYVQEQYALELPPHYVREHVHKICLELPVPDNYLLNNEPYRVLPRPTISCTAYDDRSNEWLAPVFALNKVYGFRHVKAIVLDFKVALYWRWLECDRTALQDWVMKKLESDQAFGKEMSLGNVTVLFPSAEWPEN